MRTLNAQNVQKKVKITMNERNKILFNKIADVVEFDEGVYDQSLWGGHIWRTCDDNVEDVEHTKMLVAEQACGTSHCIAGHAAVLSGWTPKVLVGAHYRGGRTIEINWEELHPPQELVEKRNPSLEEEDMLMDTHPANVGRQLLGLTFSEADILFSEYWRPTDWDYAEDYDDGELSPGNRRAVARALRNLGDGDSIWDVTYDKPADQ